MDVHVKILNEGDVSDSREVRDGTLPVMYNECVCLPKTCLFSFLLQQ